jgi:ELAV like protein 2/3/4
MLETPPTYNIYIGGLSEDISEGDLYTFFSACGPISLTRIFRDKDTGEHMGYGFVHFTTHAGQVRALSSEFNKPVIKNSIGYTKVAMEKSTLFVGNIPQHLKEDELREALSEEIGKINKLVLKTYPPPSCASRGFCFLTFDTHREAENARRILVRAPFMGKVLTVGWAEPVPTSGNDMKHMRYHYGVL